MNELNLSKEFFTFANGFSCSTHIYSSEQERSILLLLSAIGVPAREYRAFAGTCADAGFNTAIGEHPGNSKPEPCRKMDYDYQVLMMLFIPSLFAIATKLFA